MTEATIVIGIMSALVYQDLWEVESELLRSKEIGSQMPKICCYPWQELEISGQVGQVTLRVVIIENAWLKVTIVPDLGGRIIQLENKSTRSTLWPRIDKLQPVKGGRRGAFLPQGLVPFAGNSQDTAMGVVDFRVVEPENQDGPVAVIVAGLTSDGLDWSACYSLESNSRELAIECTAHNRSVSPIRAGFGFNVDSRQSSVSKGDGFLVTQQENRATALVAHWNECVSMLPITGSLESDAVTTYSSATVFGPRQTRNWKMKLCLLDQPLALEAIRNGLIVGTEGVKLRIDCTENQAECNVFVLDADGQSWESPLVANENDPFLATFPAEIRGVVIKNKESEWLRWEKGQRSQASSQSSEIENAMLRAWDSKGESAESHILRAIAADETIGYTPFGLEGVVALSRAMKFTRNQNWAMALSEIDQAINFRADDPLLWWLRSAVERNMNDIEGERTSLLNAQYLAPMEPMLRVEAFLSTPIASSPGPSPLLKPIANDPDALLDAISILWDCGFFVDTARLMKDCLEIKETPLVRYMYAYGLIHFAHLKTEAAEQVARVSGERISPPFPNRKWERIAIEDLRIQFKDDQRLQQTWSLMIANKS